MNLYAFQDHHTLPISKINIFVKILLFLYQILKFSMLIFHLSVNFINGDTDFSDDKTESRLVRKHKKFILHDR